MLTHIIPAASFTVATTAPSLMGRASDALQWLAAHPTFVAVPLTVAVVRLIAWAFARDAARRVAAARPDLAQQNAAAAAAVISVVPTRGEH